MSDWAAKRFWTKASVAPVDEGFTIELDGRAVRTPLKTLLTMPSRALAEGVAAEWDAQEERIVPDTMPLTRAARNLPSASSANSPLYTLPRPIWSASMLSERSAVHLTGRPSCFAANRTTGYSL